MVVAPLSIAAVCVPLTTKMHALAEADLDLLQRQAAPRPLLLLRKRKAVVENAGSPLPTGRGAMLTEQGRGGDGTLRDQGEMEPD